MPPPPPPATKFRLRRTSSWSSDDSRAGDGDNRGGPAGNGRTLEPPVLVYHESARSIVFRDQLRRAVGHKNEADQHYHVTPSDLPPLKADITTNAHNAAPANALSSSDPRTLVTGFTPRIQPLPAMELGPNDVFQPLLDSSMLPTDDWTMAEREVVSLLNSQHACVKTIKNTDWNDFVQRFLYAKPPLHAKYPNERDDIPADADFRFNSFVTSTTLLPAGGKKMRAYGSTTQYTTGVVFGLPTEFGNDSEDDLQARTQTWSWPAGYSAKTEFNIDGRGRLINGRQEALRPLSVLRSYNDDYLHATEYMVANRTVSGLQTIPYNEVYLRVGGMGRMVQNVDVGTGGVSAARSLARGVGLPLALFVRTATFGHLISLLRTRARLCHVLGDANCKTLPLLYLTPEDGVRVLTTTLQRDLWIIASNSLNPFQNATIAHRTTLANTDDASFQQKVDELLDLDESIRELLTPEELARLAGGFGATDESVATLLKQLVLHDKRQNKQHGQEQVAATVADATDVGVDQNSSHYGSTTSKGRGTSHKLQDVVNEGLAAAVRAGDYHTSRQLLILYSLVASQAETMDDDADDVGDDSSASTAQSGDDGEPKQKDKPRHIKHESSLGRKDAYKEELRLARRASQNGLLAATIPAPPPPPPLDTDRLRSATNSDGLLAVLGAAQVLKAMQDGTAERRTMEAVSAVEEWVNYGEQSMAFRISSWYDQRAAQGDLKIATEQNSNFMAFVSNKAIANRKNFASQLRKAASATTFNDLTFLTGLSDMLRNMGSPCLRLELLQYVLGLDNRYSVAHVQRSVELAATCLGISTTPA